LKNTPSTNTILEYLCSVVLGIYLLCW